METYVGPMVLRPDGQVERKETAPAEVKAAPGFGDETQPLHAGRVKRSLAGARACSTPLLPGRVILRFTWGPKGVWDDLSRKRAMQ